MILQADIEILARTIYGEARGEPQDGKLAVGQVMVNRFRSTKGQFAKDDTIATVCLRHVQFSAWTVGDPNFEEIQRVALNSVVFRRCWRAALDALDTDIPDLTEGSLHYCTLRARPRWAAGHAPVVVIGGHRFFNDVA